MAGKPPEPIPSGQRPAGTEPLAAGGGGSGGRADEREHSGPVAIERYVKDDGRALILYFDERRTEDPPRQA
jgi:hypothetical protein